MNTYCLIRLVPVLTLLLWAAVVDLRARRIPNWLTFSLALSGLAQSFLPAHFAPPGQAMLGFLTGLGLTFVLFAMGALGGGDVKLLAGVGAWLGPEVALRIFLLAAIVGMIIVIFQAVMQGSTAKLFRNSALIAMNAAHVGEMGIEHMAESGRACRSVERPLPYAVPVLIAVMFLISCSFVSGR